VVDGPETVLVVDDNLQNREVAEGHLMSAGYVAIQADGGESALVLFEDRRPDLVLLDVVMPRMDGFETCRRIRALPGGRDTPILFLTALGDLGTHKAALDSGADDFLTKPINRTELLLRVRSLLRIKKLSSELEQNYEVIRTQRDALLEAQRQKKELATLIVHDLKNPLSSILSNIQFLTGSRDMHDGERESLDDVLRASRTMFRMVMNLLDISRSEDGALVPRYGAFDVAALLREIASETVHRLEDKKQKLALAVGPEIGEITADRDLIRRVIENLVDNAYKYSPRESTITISVVCAGAAGGPAAGGAAGAAGAALAPAAWPPSVEIRVHDEGEGIPVAYRSRIFDKYVRIGDHDQAELRNSHGLGLVFCRTAVAVHGGEIWVEDNSPKGSRFCLRLAREPTLPAPVVSGDDDDRDGSAHGRLMPLSAAAIASAG
jgi:two-component system sensor histidine kinase/response regulator